MKITLIRHAEVVEKYSGCYNRHIDISLSENGHNQAREIAQKFQNEKFDAVFCSDLKRAKETLNYFSHAKEKVIYTDKLREKSWGKHEGMSFDEIISQGEIEYKNFLQWIDALDGESKEAFMARVDKFFFEFLPTTHKENILIVTHSGVIKVFLSLTKNITMEEAFSINIPYCHNIIYKKFKTQ